MAGHQHLKGALYATFHTGQMVETRISSTETFPSSAMYISCRNRYLYSPFTACSLYHSLSLSETYTHIPEVDIYIFSYNIIYLADCVSTIAVAGMLIFLVWQDCLSFVSAACLANSLIHSV